MFQITDGTFAEARKFCIRDHQVVTDGPWYDLAFLLVQQFLYPDPTEPFERNDRRAPPPKRGQYAGCSIALQRSAWLNNKGWLP